MSCIVFSEKCKSLDISKIPWKQYSLIITFAPVNELWIFTKWYNKVPQKVRNCLNLKKTLNEVSFSPIISPTVYVDPGEHFNIAPDPVYPEMQLQEAAQPAWIESFFVLFL